MPAKYKLIARDLESQLSRMPANMRRLPTEAVLCARYSCSRQTVRSALALLEADGKIVKRRGSGSYLAEASSGSREIALILSDQEEYLAPRLIRDIRIALAETNLTLHCYDTFSDPERERQILMTLCRRKPAGILMEPIRNLYGTENTDVLNRLREVPFLYLGSAYIAPDTAQCLRTDDGEGIYTLLCYLAAKGHRQISAILKADDSRGVARYRGLVQGCRDLGLEFRDENCLWYSQWEKQMLLDGSDEMLRRFLRDYRTQSTAVVCFNDEVAFRLLRFTGPGRNAPAVLSFDNSYYATGEASITSLGQSGESFGTATARILLEMLGGKSPVLAPLPWQLYSRRSG